jgi:hypothetical protein
MLIPDFREMNAQELKQGTKQFAHRMMRLVDVLPKTPKGKRFGISCPAAGIEEFPISKQKSEIRN